MKADNSNEKIYLDQEGYEKYLKEIETLKAEYNNNCKEKGEAYETAVGDGWHDNFGFEQAKREEYKILGELRRKYNDLKRIVIVEKSQSKSDVVEINDYVELLLDYEDEDSEKEIFKLVGSDNGDLFGEVSEVTLNSPIGKTIYHQEVGYKGSFEVNGYHTKLEILKKANSLDELKQIKNDAPQKVLK